MNFAIKRLLLGVALALAVTATAGADTIISTLGNPEVGTDTNSETNAAQGFTTGSQAETLSSVTLDLLAGNGSIVVSLLNDNGFNSPGTLVLSLGTINPTHAGYFNYTLAAPSTLILTANTQYWLAVQYDHVVTVAAPGPWAFTNGNPPGYTVTGSGTLGDFANFYSGDTNWTVLSSDTYGPYILSVNSGVVPEPSTLFSATVAILFGFGVTIYKHRKGKVDDVA